ncbi:gluconate 2-dehydrogenase subunit 3 family protein [Variovorax sp. GB1P17]|uniref:gluconate 2-dehydrogenase subunit 3 family protein n=1 Tax=Variovorax sp. GB1P17 TaxID=3443740 RepID=UPI003F450FBE
MGLVQIGLSPAIASPSSGLAASPAEGYGLDPNLVTPLVPWVSVMTADQLLTIEVLSDAILPGTGSLLNPRDAGIGSFFAEWLSAPYPTQQTDRQTVLDGLGLVEAECRGRFGCNLATLTPQQLHVIVVWMATANPTEKVNRFFVRLRYLLIGGYFTTDAGMRELGYRGNVPLLDFPPVTAEAQAIIREELARLGL